MNRRNFHTSATVLGASSLLSIVGCNKPEVAPSRPARSNFKMGYQLFSVNEDMKRDPIGTLQALKEMGYEDFEIYGFDPDALTYYGIKAEDFATTLEELDLTVTSGHYGFTDYLDRSDTELRKYVAACIQGAKTLRSPYITWPWLAPRFRNMDGYKKMASKLNPIGEQIKDAGLTFAYHNHGFEFDDHGGTSGYELILSATDPALVKLQMDMYWVMHSGTTTPKELVQQHPGRYVMWHIKDMDAVTRDYSELGRGAINYLNVLPAPQESGLQYYNIEQGGNFATSAIESARSSGRYMQEHLVSLL